MKKEEARKVLIKRQINYKENDKMIYKLENHKSMRFGLNYSFTSEYLYKQMTLKFLLPWFIWKERYYDIERDEFMFGWRLRAALFVFMFAFATGSSPVGKQRPVKWSIIDHSGYE